MPAPRFFTHDRLAAFVSALIARGRVIGPVAKKDQFVFAELASAAELRLDHDLTVLPPKKAFFPPRQALVSFDASTMQSCLEPTAQVLLGVHLHDVLAIDMLDALFRSPHEDRNYLAHRELTTIVACTEERVHPRAFFTSMSQGRQPQGHDAILTRIEGGYLYDPRTSRGEDLLALAVSDAATAEQVAGAEAARAAVVTQVTRHMEGGADEIARRVRRSFGDRSLWEGLARDCFSCGACNLVCPTCYCFDVQDRWNLDQVSGIRERTWDGCLLEDFATISLGGGRHENFRPDPASRFRHRVMRKLAYLNPKLGGPACVGCGRCAAACVPDIADPVDIVQKVLARGEGT